MHPDFEPQRTAARQSLATLRVVFDQVAAALAQRCGDGQHLGGRKLDEQQVASFELAWAAADLLAAETGIAALHANSGELDTRLALLFAVDAGGAVGRLETLSLELGLPLASLRSMRDDPSWDLLRQSAAGAQALAAAGRGVAAARGEVGAVPLDESHALAQESFRRFSQEVVAPLAEQIHRENLTVPESLLQPLREMGVFGLSVPEQYGGSAPDAHEDSLLMVLVTEALSEGSLAAAGNLITRPEILTRALLAGGAREQQAHWLPRLAVGEPLCAIAITEPDYGSDVASLGLRAASRAAGA